MGNQEEKFESPFDTKDKGVTQGMVSIGQQPAQPTINVADIKETTEQTDVKALREERPIGHALMALALQQTQQQQGEDAGGEQEQPPIVGVQTETPNIVPAQPTYTPPPFTPVPTQPSVVEKQPEVSTTAPPMTSTPPTQQVVSTPQQPVTNVPNQQAVQQPKQPSQGAVLQEGTKELATPHSAVPTNVNMMVEATKEMKVFGMLFSNHPKLREMKEYIVRMLGKNNIFQDEFYIYYSILYSKPKVKISEEYIRLYVQTNRAHFSNTPSINLVKYKIGNNDEYAEFMLSCISLWRECSNLKVDEEEFYTALEMLQMEYVNDKAITVLQESAKILVEGIKVRGQDIKGYDGMKSHMNRELTKIDNIVNQSDKQGIVAFGDDAYGDEEEQLKLITTFGIEGLDEHIHGIYEGDMVSILAPPKGFKTRSCVHIVHNAAVQYGVTVAVWPLENGKKGTEALFRAKHFNWLYNRNETDIREHKILDADMIRRGALEGELKSLELASKTDLYSNPDYGKIYFIDEDFHVDTFEDHLEKAVKEHGAKLILVDYLQLITGDGVGAKNQRVGEAYQKSLRFLKRNKVGGLFPGQVTQDTLDYIEKKGVENLANLELRDIGAESAEVIRTPDVNILNFGTMEDIRKGRLQMVGLPSRNIQPFLPVKVAVQAGVCNFTSVPSDAW